MVVIVCALKRYRRKRNPSLAAVVPTGADATPNNAATIAAANKEKDLNEGTYINATCGKFLENEYYTIPVSQDYEISNNDVNIYDEVPY